MNEGNKTLRLGVLNLGIKILGYGHRREQELESKKQAPLSASVSHSTASYLLTMGEVLTPCPRLLAGGVGQYQ